MNSSFSVRFKDSTTRMTKFFTSQYLYAGVRIALAIVIPSLILAYFGLLKEYFIFPLGTSFVGLTDMAGPYCRRRNTLILACVLFTFIALVGSLFQGYPFLIFLEIIFFGIFLSIIGVYGMRLAAVGGLGLVVMAIFIDGELASGGLVKTLITLFLGCFWYVIIFMSVSRLQPYKLAQQMIGENYLQLAEYSRIKAKYYHQKSDINALHRAVISKQIVIKNLQEETREVVFMTRKIVNESTTTSRILMLMFLNSIDFYEKLITTDHDYVSLHQFFKHDNILKAIEKYLETMSDELEQIGVSIQSGFDLVQKRDLYREYQNLTSEFQRIEKKYEGSNDEDTTAAIQKIRFILERIKNATEDIITIQKFKNQDTKSAKSLSTGLDCTRFVAKTEQLNHRVLLANFSLKSFHFRYAIRMTLALLIGYAITLIPYFEIGRPYWILITIVAIMRPAFSTTKGRNILRIYGTMGGAIVSYIVLVTVNSPMVLLFILLFSMILCFSFLKDNYSWAVFFMTIYIFITFNFMQPGDVNTLFYDRIIDTLVAGVIVFLVSYLVLPVWEHKMSSVLIKKTANANEAYFNIVMKKLKYNEVDEQEYRLKRKEAIISLANLSDNFQRMLSDPKKEQKKMEYIHQFVNTSHLVTAYTASLSQYSWNQYFQNDKELNQLNHCISSDFQVISEMLTASSVGEQKSNLSPEILSPESTASDTDLHHIYDVLFLLHEVVSEQKRLIQRQMKESK